MVRHGASRRKIARKLKAAYGDGLLSEETFTGRIEQLLGKRLVDPRTLVGDLSFRGQNRWRNWVAAARSVLSARRALQRGRPELLLALDWSGGEQELLVGRHYTCDVVLSDPTVSRRHARLAFRDGAWIVQDLESTNGTAVNGVHVGRCALRPGDHVRLGEERLKVD